MGEENKAPIFDPGLIRVGIEFETNINVREDPCRDCSRDGCEFCSLCEVCVYLRGMFRRREYRVEVNCSPDACQYGCRVRVYNDRNEEVYDIAPRRRRLFCRLAREHYLCPDPCQECEESGEDPEEVAEELGVNMNYVERAYVDGSCGLEVCSKPLTLRELLKARKAVWEPLKDRMSPKNTCGGHTNISYHPFASCKEEMKHVVLEAAFFADVLAYHFLTEHTAYRRGEYYRDYDASTYAEIVHGVWDSTGKYSYLNLKDYNGVYVYEFRWPDGVENFNAHYIATVLMAVIVARPKLHVLAPRLTGSQQLCKRVLKKVERAYKRCCNSNFGLVDASLMKRKLKKLVEMHIDEIKRIEEYTGVNILQAVKEVARNPVYRRKADIPLQTMLFT